MASGVLLGDGANGTYLQKICGLRPPFDLAVLSAPELVLTCHKEYLAAGADIIETNSFQANRLRIGEESWSIKELNQRAAEIAQTAAKGFSDRYILGAIGPSGKSIEPFGSVTKAEIRANAAEQASGLFAGGVDGFILETFIDLGEMEATIEGIRQVCDLPIIASKAFVEDGEALMGDLPFKCASQMANMDVIAIGANCIVGPQRMTDLIRKMSEATDLPILSFPTPGLSQLVKGVTVYDSKPEYFAKAVARLIDEGASIIGGCCGTLPSHIEELRKYVTKGKERSKSRVILHREAIDGKPLLIADPTELSLKLKAGNFITAVEMDVPRGLNIDKLLAGAKRLKEAGIDAVNISDGARARLRMNPSAVGNLIQSQVGLEVVMHFSCRDRNLLAIQSDLLGCHALGVRNILAVTGDPANVGDYPSATSVFDVDSIGLTRILARFNEGIDLAGYSIGMKCAFTIAVAYNPLAQNQKDEDERLRTKVDSGATLVYTQPVFERKEIERSAQICSELNVPCLIGVLPLRSYRHAEFMHNEVPGIDVPASIRKEMAEANSDEDALEIGIKEAVKLAKSVRKQARGLYLMPPFGNSLIAMRVLKESEQ